MKIPRIMCLHFHEFGGEEQKQNLQGLFAINDVLEAFDSLTPIIAKRSADRVRNQRQKSSTLNGHGHTALLTAI